jgi:hypothetical protein
MIACGIDIKSKTANLVLVGMNANTPFHIQCQTKKLVLGEDKDTGAINDMLATIKSFSQENKVDIFAIKNRALSGMRSANGVTFKIETLFQLSKTPVVFVSAPTLAKFAKSNQGGLPVGVLVYQQDAYRVGAYHLTNV